MKQFKIFFFLTLFIFFFSNAHTQMRYNVISDTLRAGSFSVGFEEANKCLGKISFNVDFYDSLGHRVMNEELQIKNGKLCNRHGKCDSFITHSPFGFAQVRIPNLRSIKLEKLKTTDMNISGILEVFTADTSKLGRFQVLNSNIKYFWLGNDSIQICYMENDTVTKFNIYDSDIKYFTLRNVKIDNLRVDNTSQPTELFIKNLDLGDNNAVLDLTQFKNEEQKTCVLGVSLSEISKLRFNYSNYKISFSEEVLERELNAQYLNSYKQSMYTIIIDLQKKYGFADGEEKVTKEYKSFQYTKNNSLLGIAANWLDRTWWDYGYEKGLIFRNTFYLLLLFYVFNLFGYRKLVHNLYPLNEFVKADEQPVQGKFRRVRRYAAYCLFYTGYVFLGLRLDFKILILKNLWLAAYIIIQSIVGLICLAYIANYIISK